MKLSEDTLTILKNFSVINQNVYLQSGQKLHTINVSGTVFVSATIEEDFPVSFAVYDLSKFLAVLSLFESPDLDFEKSFLTISENNKTVKYGYAELGTILYPKKTNVDIGDDLISLDVSKSDLSSMLKSSSVMGLPHISIIGQDDNLSLVASDKKNPSTDNFTIDLKQETDKTFEAVLLVERMLFLSGNYELEISTQGVIHWSNSDIPVQYWTTVETNDSSF
jgi:hypothetical protein